MAQFKKLQVLNVLHSNGIVPVFYHPDEEVCKTILRAVYDGGIRVFEFTNRGDGAHKIFGSLIKWAKQALPEMVIGIGSIVDAATAALFIQEGANFVVAPTVNPEVATTCNRRKIPWMPGCGSLTEINYAESLGADIVKIFPAQQVGGPDFIKAVKGPCPWSNIMPTGGVKPEDDNLKSWFNAGAFCVGIGSQLFIKNKQGNYDLDKIKEASELSVNAFKKYNTNNY